MSILTLSLANPSIEGGISYKVSAFPDGQQSITINDIDSIAEDNTIIIESRMNSFRDVELIVCAAQALREAGIYDVHLFVPYFIGARSDRKFVSGSSNYLKTVICPIINAQEFTTVTVMDPHSDVLEACLDNFCKIDNVDLVKFALSDIAHPSVGLTKTVLVSPDAGALKKIYHVAEGIGNQNDIIIASKHRDIVTGNILETRVPGIHELSNDPLDFIIIDDICDGGRTFIELAKAIRNARPTEIFKDNIFLVITHGIFSAGFKNLSPYFTGIYCTNSIKDIADHVSEEFVSEDGTKYMAPVITKVKQLKVL